MEVSSCVEFFWERWKTRQLLRNEEKFNSYHGTKKFLGEGVFLQQEFPEEKKQQPYNKGKKYFFWSIATTILLLKECLDKDISAVNL